MIKIRLTKVGKKHYNTYRIAVMNAREKRESRAIEILGSYDPHLTENKYRLDAERVKYWLGVGAQPTDTVRRFLVKEKMIAAPKFKQKFNVAPGKKAQERLKAKEAKAAAAEPAA